VQYALLEEDDIIMSLKELKASVNLGEDSRRQFKQNVTNANSLAAEMAAFANSEGGTIFLGVADDGTLTGLDKEDVARLNQLISNAASQNVRSPLTVQSANVAVGKGRVIIVLTIPKGLDKPYFDRNGVIWLKSGADKRRVNSKEELREGFSNSQTSSMPINCLPGPGLTSWIECVSGISCAMPIIWITQNPSRS
jgi:ATP-dependent DNA helicase RecG